MRKILFSLATDWIVVCLVLIGCVFMSLTLIGHVVAGEGSVLSDALRGNDPFIILLGITSFPAMIPAFFLSLPFYKFFNQAAWPFYMVSFIFQIFLYALFGKLISFIVRRNIPQEPVKKNQ